MSMECVSTLINIPGIARAEKIRGKWVPLDAHVIRDASFRAPVKQLHRSLKKTYRNAPKKVIMSKLKVKTIHCNRQKKLGLSLRNRQ